MKRCINAISIAVLLTVSSFGQNIVQNPGFEDGFVFQGWNSYAFNPIQGQPSLAHSGMNAVVTPCTGHASVEPGGCRLFQTLNTPGNQKYDIGLWVAEYGDATSEFTVYFGDLIADVVNPAHNTCTDQTCTYIYFEFDNVQGNDGTTLFQILGRQDDGLMYFDDISVTPVSDTPEPTTFMLLGTALLAAVTKSRR